MLAQICPIISYYASKKQFNISNVNFYLSFNLLLCLFLIFLDPNARSRRCSTPTVRFCDIASITNLGEISCLHRRNLLDSHRHAELIHSQDVSE